jgi:protease PrsW
VRALLPGFGLAVVLHSAFNHLLMWPKLATLAILIVLPPLLYAVFQRSEKAVGDWLGQGFDTDTEMLELMNSGRLSDSPVGEYLITLKSKFKGPVVADLLCYLRLYTELALRAKGILMMNESGFEVSVDEETRAKFEEMRYLESSIGKTGLLAIPTDVPHEPQGLVAALYAGEVTPTTRRRTQPSDAILLHRAMPPTAEQAFDRWWRRRGTGRMQDAIRQRRQR